MNILFIMCDQLRADYLSCYGHPHLKTPNIDELAKRGVQFNKAYVQAPLCGPSRMSFYTGRYNLSHGATMNGAALRIDERTLGDYLQQLNAKTVVVGKTEVVPNIAEMQRLGIDPTSEIGQRIAQAGFEPYFRHEGLVPEGRPQKNTPYNQYLKERNYSGNNPWHTATNSGKDENGAIKSGWLWGNSNLPAEVKEEDSETVVTVSKAIEFIEEQQEDQAWCLHVSFIKPHWPYIAPAPYHNYYTEEDILLATRSDQEKENPHPVHQSLMKDQVEALAYNEEGKRNRIIKAYMGLVKQIDDQIGRLVQYLKDKEALEDTFIVFTSDHGDHLGDHWIGEKFMFYEAGVRVPLLIVDPSSKADVTRGTIENRLVEAIDLVPTFVEVMGGKPNQTRLEGHSLLPLLHGQHLDDWRNYVISELNFSFLEISRKLQKDIMDCRSFMVRTHRWKYVHFIGFPPQLFDLENDAQEFKNLANNPAYSTIQQEMQDLLMEWLQSRKVRTTLPSEVINNKFQEENYVNMGVLIGYWDEEQVEEFKTQIQNSNSKRDAGN